MIKYCIPKSATTHSQQLCMCSRVAHAREYGRQEQTEGVQRHEIAHLGHTVRPAFPILECCEHMAFIVMLASSELFVCSQSLSDASSLFGVEEPGGVRLNTKVWSVIFFHNVMIDYAYPVEHHPPAEAADHYAAWPQSQRPTLLQIPRETYVARPSMIKIQAHPPLPPNPSICAIAAARRPPKDPARAALAKNTASRIPSSDRLYQQLR